MYGKDLEFLILDEFFKKFIYEREEKDNGSKIWGWMRFLKIYFSFCNGKILWMYKL